MLRNKGGGMSAEMEKVVNPVILDDEKYFQNIEEACVPPSLIHQTCKKSGQY